MFWLFLSFMFSFYTTLPCCFISQPIATLGGGPNGPAAVAFSPVSNCLAVANFNAGSVTIYSSSTCDGYSSASLVATITDGISNPNSLAFSPDGKCLAVANEFNNNITIYSNESPSNCAGFNNATIQATITDQISLPFAVAFSQDGNCLAVGNYKSQSMPNGYVTIYNNSHANCTGYDMATVRATITNSINTPLGVAFMGPGEGSCLAVANAGNSNNITFYPNNTSESDCTGYNGAVATAVISDQISLPYQISFSPEGNCLAVANFFGGASGNGSVTIYNNTSQNSCAGWDQLTANAIITNGISGADGVSFSPDGSCLAVANNNNNTVTLYSKTSQGTCGFTSSSLPVATIGSGLSGVSGLAFCGDGKYLAVANPNDNGGTIEFYNSQSCIGYDGATPSSIINLSNTLYPSGVSFSADGKCFAVSSYANSNGGNVTLFSSPSCNDYSTAMPTTSINFSSNEGPYGVALSADGMCMAVSDPGNGNVNLYQAQTSCGFPLTPNVTIATGPNSSPYGVSFSAGGTCLAVANTGLNNVLIYNSSSTGCGFTDMSMPVATINSGIEFPQGLAFSSDGTCLAIANSPSNNSGSVTIYTSQSCGGYNLAAPVATITNGIFSPSGVSFSPDVNCLAVTNTGANSVTFYTKLNPVITGPNLVCQGSSASLFADVSPFQDNTNPTYLTYQWLLNGAVISGATGNTFTTDAKLAVGTYVYTVQVSDPSGCGPVTSAAFTVVVDGVVGTPASFSTCSGVALQGTISAASSSGSPITTYTFTQPGHGQLGSLTSSDGSFIYTSNSGFSGSDTFTFTATDANGCVSAPSTVTINVDNAAIVLSSIGVLPNVGVPVTLVATPTAGIAPFTFKWSDGLVQTGSSAVSRVVEPVVTTSYSVIIIDSKGCQSDPSNTLTVSEVTRSSLSQALQAKYCVAG